MRIRMGIRLRIGVVLNILSKVTPDAGPTFSTIIVNRLLNMMLKHTI
jgi:hypothetical protein